MEQRETEVGGRGRAERERDREKREGEEEREREREREKQDIPEQTVGGWGYGVGSRSAELHAAALFRVSLGFSVLHVKAERGQLDNAGPD